MSKADVKEGRLVMDREKKENEGRNKHKETTSSGFSCVWLRNMLNPPSFFTPQIFIFLFHLKAIHKPTYYYRNKHCVFAKHPKKIHRMPLNPREAICGVGVGNHQNVLLGTDSTRRMKSRRDVVASQILLSHANPKLDSFGMKHLYFIRPVENFFTPP